MRITVVGTGYVGLVLGACLAESGNTVVCVDSDLEKICNLKEGILPIYEPELSDFVFTNYERGRLEFTTALAEAVGASDVVFIAVGTPQAEDGSADLQHVLAAATEIGRALTHDTVIVVKSTVPVGTAEQVREHVAAVAQYGFSVVSNPEFLKEGSAVRDFTHPDRVVIGTNSEWAAGIVTDLYAPFVRSGHPIFLMDNLSAELTKYAANAMLATRISFMNEIANLCEAVGANVDQVRLGMGADSRIGQSFLFAGPGYGGSCFPKDVRALMMTAVQADEPLQVLTAVASVNKHQKHRLTRKLQQALGTVAGNRIAVWGLAFKPQTDDIRESPALALIDDLLALDAVVVVHDPIVGAQRAAHKLYGGRVRFVKTAYEAVEQADALAIVTDHAEYRSIDLAQVRRTMRRTLVVDGRNLYEPRKMAHVGFEYASIGRRRVQ